MIEGRPAQPRRALHAASFIEQSDFVSPIWRAVVLVVVLSASLATTSRGDDVPKGVTGDVKLSSGRVASYTLHFDRNSLRDSLRLGDSLIALTSSGTLLRFELPTIRPARERIGAGGDRLHRPR